MFNSAGSLANRVWDIGSAIEAAELKLAGSISAVFKFGAKDSEGAWISSTNRVFNIGVLVSIWEGPNSSAIEIGVGVMVNCE